MSVTAEAFDRGAARYDRMVSMNPGYHRELRRCAALLLSRLRGVDAMSLLDMGCGSGASTRALVDAAPGDARVLGLDASPGMLAQARAKSWPERVSFSLGVAGRLDVDAVGGSRDGILACYLLRNVPEGERGRALAEMYRLLRPGGVVALQDYSVAGHRRARWVWDVVCWGIIMPLGILIDRNPRLYHYLWRSVRAFDSVDELVRRLHTAGFVDVAHETASGWQRGVLHTVLARKPEES